MFAKSRARPKKMADPPRQCTIRLADGEKLNVPISSRLLTSELTSLAASHSSLRLPDKDLFALAYVDSLCQFHWLREKRVLECDFARDAPSASQLNLVHAAKFFVDSIYNLEHANTVEMYFLEAHNQLAQNQLDVTDIDYVKLSAYLLQVYAGDHTDEIAPLPLLRGLLPLPPPFLQHYNTTREDMEQRIIEQYRHIKGTARGNAIISFMQIAERSSTYGSRFYVVTDKEGVGGRLAVNNRGIYHFTGEDLSAPAKVFHWKFLDNLYYRDNKFCLDVRDSRRIVQSSGNLDSLLEGGSVEDADLARAVNDPTTQVSTSRRGLAAPSVQVHTFLLESAALCKTLWSAAVAQHQFYIEHIPQKKPSSRSGVSHSELSDRLSRLVSRSSIASSLPSLSSLHSASSSVSTMPSAKVGDGSCVSLPSLKSAMSQKSDEERARDVELYKQLRAKKEALEEKLRQKLADLRIICIKEGELTGEMPKEITRVLLPGEEAPRLKKRVGTAFLFNDEILPREKGDHETQLVADIELHRKIVAAAERLAKDKSTNKSVRKKRQRDLAAAALKLRGLEVGLSQMRLSASRPDVSSIGGGVGGGAWQGGMSTKSCPTTPRGSVPDLRDGDKSEYEDDDECDARPASGASCQRSQSQHFASSSSPHRPSPSTRGRTASRGGDQLDNPLLTPTNQSPQYENIGYRSSATYQSSYRQSHYPTLHEQQLRKRAQSEHTLSRQPAPSSATASPQVPAYAATPPSSTYNLPLQSAVHRFEKQERDDTVSPLRRPLPQSQSCGAGFTASLDRRPRPAPTQSPLATHTPHGQTQTHATSHRVTTFPVHHHGLYHENSPLAGVRDSVNRYRSPQGRSPLTEAIRQPPSYQYGVTRSAVSASRLPETDPRMEALLEYYKDSARKNQHKTATIV